MAMLTFAAGQGLAQEKGFKEMITGPWTVTSVVDERPDGKKVETWNGPVTGQLTFGRTGRFTQIIVGPPIASMKGNDPRKPDALVVAYYGSYTVDEAGKKINAKILGGGYSARVNTEISWTVQGSGDNLVLIGSPRSDASGPFSPKLEVTRVK